MVVSKFTAYSFTRCTMVAESGSGSRSVFRRTQKTICLVVFCKIVFFFFAAYFQVIMKNVFFVDFRFRAKRSMVLRSWFFYFLFFFVNTFFVSIKYSVSNIVIELNKTQNISKKIRTNIILDIRNIRVVLQNPSFRSSDPTDWVLKYKIKYWNKKYCFTSSAVDTRRRLFSIKKELYNELDTDRILFEEFFDETNRKISQLKNKKREKTEIFRLYVYRTFLRTIKNVVW